MISRRLIIFFTGLLSFCPIFADSQVNRTDSLELPSLIQKVLETYPSVKQASEALNAADVRIAIAKSAFSPNAQFSGSFAHIGPVPTLTLPEVGSFSLAPENNYNAIVSVNQTISDFGKTRKSIELEERNKELSKLGVEQIRQRLSLLVTNCFYNLLYYQEAVHIKEKQLATLQIHLNTIEKKSETGSATQFEILSTKVRISTIESQKTDAVTGFNFQNTILNALLGEPSNTIHLVKKKIEANLLSFSVDSMVNIALENRNEIKIAKAKLSIFEANKNFVLKHENPVLSAFANGGWKNGYIPQLDKPRANYAIGISLLIPIYDAKRTNLNVKLVGSSIISGNFEMDIARRNITAEVVECLNLLKAATSKTDLFSMQLTQSGKALELAELKFKTGTLTNLDLLDSESAFAESNLLYLKSSIEKAVAFYNLKSALGVNLF